MWRGFFLSKYIQKSALFITTRLYLPTRNRDKLLFNDMLNLIIVGTKLIKRTFCFEQHGFNILEIKV